MRLSWRSKCKDVFLRGCFSFSGVISSSGMFWTSSWVVVGVATSGGDGALSAGMSCGVAGGGVVGVGVSVCASVIASSSRIV